jgi:hypothetical protein
MAWIGLDGQSPIDLALFSNTPAVALGFSKNELAFQAMSINCYPQAILMSAAPSRPSSSSAYSGCCYFS